MGDSVTAADIPRDRVQLVAGYVDGLYRWSDADWSLFPDKIKVRIAVFAQTNDGHVLDVEQGAADPAQVPAWILMRRAAGIDPTVYVNRGNWQACKNACWTAGVPQPHWWVAAYDNIAALELGMIAKQYANPTIIGAHYDLSVVADFWPGVDPEVPQRVGQSADVVIKTGEIAELQAFFVYRGTPRAITRKVWAHRAGRYVVTVNPPVDPDADETIHLDLEPAIFVVDVTAG